MSTGRTSAHPLQLGHTGWSSMTPDDPRMVLIGVTVHAAEFLEVNKSKPVLLYELVKGWVTGEEPDLGEMHTIGDRGRP